MFIRKLVLAVLVSATAAAAHADIFLPSPGGSGSASTNNLASTAYVDAAVAGVTNGSQTNGLMSVIYGTNAIDIAARSVSNAALAATANASNQSTTLTLNAAVAVSNAANAAALAAGVAASNGAIAVASTNLNGTNIFPGTIGSTQIQDGTIVSNDIDPTLDAVYRAQGAGGGGGTNYWGNWFGSNYNAGTVGGPMTAVVDFATARQIGLTATATPINVFITNSGLPTNYVFDGRLAVMVNGWLGTAVVNVVNVRYAGGTNSGRYSGTMGTVTNQVDFYDIAWSGWWTNSTAGQFVLKNIDKAVN